MDNADWNGIVVLPYDMSRQKHWSDVTTQDQNNRSIAVELSTLFAKSATTDPLYIWEEIITPTKDMIIASAICSGQKFVSFVIVLFVAVMMMYKLYRTRSVSTGIVAVMVGIIVYAIYIISRCNTRPDSLETATANMRGSLTDMLHKHPLLLRYVSVINTDFETTSFITDVINLNISKHLTPKL